MSRSLGQRLTAASGTLTFGVGLVALFMGISNWWLVFVVGWFVVTPLLAILFDAEDEVDQDWTDHDERQHEATTESGAKRQVGDSKQDALETLRDRYARGELSEEQFETKLDRLLNTETLEDARDYAATADRDDDSETTDFGEVRSGSDRSGREPDYET